MQVKGLGYGIAGCCLSWCWDVQPLLKKCTIDRECACNNLGALFIDGYLFEFLLNGRNKALEQFKGHRSAASLACQHATIGDDEPRNSLCEPVSWRDLTKNLLVEFECTR